MRFFFVLLMFIIPGCSTNKEIYTANTIAESNKDVLLLASLIRKYAFTNEEKNINLTQLLEKDTSNRIKHNFYAVQMKYHWGYISVDYIFSAQRNVDFTLTDAEKKMLKWQKWKSQKKKGNYDGEIRFDFRERFYKIKKIIVNRE